MPIIIFKDGSTNISTPIFVGPDKEGSFPIYPDRELLYPPVGLDPQGEIEVKALLNGTLSTEEDNSEVQLDYSDADIKNKERILRVEGPSYSKKFYLSREGIGGALGKNLGQNLSPHEYKVIPITQAKSRKGYRRTREGDSLHGEVTGWELNVSFLTRRFGR